MCYIFVHFNKSCTVCTCHDHHHHHSSSVRCGSLTDPNTSQKHLSITICCPAKNPPHYHNKFNCEGGSKVSWEQSYCFSPLHSLSLSLCLFVTNSPLRPRVMMTLSGGEPEIQRGDNFVVRRTNVGLHSHQEASLFILYLIHLCLFRHQSLWRTRRRPSGCHLVGNPDGGEGGFLFTAGLKWVFIRVLSRLNPL